jgi:hypothetical protein
MNELRMGFGSIRVMACTILGQYFEDDGWLVSPSSRPNKQLSFINKKKYHEAY